LLHAGAFGRSLNARDHFAIKQDETEEHPEHLQLLIVRFRTYMYDAVFALQ